MGLALVLHDTTESSFQRERPEMSGNIGVSSTGKDNAGRRLHLHNGLQHPDALAPGYVGDLFMVYGNMLTDYPPIMLIRGETTSLRVDIDRAIAAVHRLDIQKCEGA